MLIPALLAQNKEPQTLWKGRRGCRHEGVGGLGGCCQGRPRACLRHPGRGCWGWEARGPAQDFEVLCLEWGRAAAGQAQKVADHSGMWVRSRIGKCLN